MKAGPPSNSKYDIPTGANKAVEDLIQKTLRIGYGNYKSLEGRGHLTDYLAHIDIICNHAPRRYFNIQDMPVCENHTISIDVKCPSYQNWYEEEYYTAPFSRTLLSHGQNTMILWCYMDKHNINIEGWIAVLWSGKLAAQIVANEKRYLSSRLLSQASGMVGDPFYFVYLKDLLGFFSGHVLGYDLSCMTNPALISITSTPRPIKFI